MQGRMMGRASKPISVTVMAILAVGAMARGQSKLDEIAPISPIAPTLTLAPSTPAAPAFSIPDLTKKENVSGAMQAVALMTVVSLAPAILIMMTSFTRIVIVLSLLRQALGTQQLPPNQVLIGLAMFMTFLVMGPTWKRVNSDALQPYMDGRISPQAALENAQAPVRDF